MSNLPSGYTHNSDHSGCVCTCPSGWSGGTSGTYTKMDVVLYKLAVKKQEVVVSHVMMQVNVIMLY